ncbi:hypothetical protein FB45DRAFT_895530 [Roridomyces roridus]|uniref:Zn(2)-C6 fungal-type domain-containing protein n=1 Tax=Roridomyces roridus TaxID=1738132 RepID=A0AAD7C9Y7_9AGAR|nr:hypothetical protein FB45DRAFT_895530 [Roridomyces roridus]
MSSDHIDAIHGADDDRFYAVFPDARPSPRQAQFVDPASSWVFYPPTMTNYLSCSPSAPSFATAVSPISPSESEYYYMGDTPPPSATSITTNASFASHSPDLIYESPGVDDTLSPSPSSEPYLISYSPVLAPAPPTECDRPSVPHLFTTTDLSSAQPLAAPPNKKLKGLSRRRRGTGAIDLTQKPAIACFYCRNRKIACGPPADGTTQAGCNQCQRRALKCEYPLDCRRGKNKKKKQPASATPPPGEEGVAEGKDKDGGEADVQVDEGVTGEGEEDAVKADELHLDGAVPVHVSAPSASVPVLTVNVQLEKTRDPRRSPAPPSAPVPRDARAKEQDPAVSAIRAETFS